jgi:hypothetical protein
LIDGPVTGRHLIAADEAKGLTQKWLVSLSLPPQKEFIPQFSLDKAAEAIDQALAGNANALETHDQIISNQWDIPIYIVWAQRVAGLFYCIPRFGYKIGVKRLAATERIGRSLRRELRYADVANFAIKRLSSSLLPEMK